MLRPDGHLSDTHRQITESMPRRLRIRSPQRSAGGPLRGSTASREPRTRHHAETRDPRPMPSRHTPPPQASSQVRRRMSSPGISQGAPRLRPAPGRHSTSGQRLCPAPPVVRGHQARYHSTPAMRAYPGSHPPAGSHTASSQGTGSQDPPGIGRPPGGRPGRGWGPGRQRPPHPRSSRHHHTHTIDRDPDTLLPGRGRYMRSMVLDGEKPAPVASATSRAYRVERNCGWRSWTIRSYRAPISPPSLSTVSCR